MSARSALRAVLALALFAPGAAFAQPAVDPEAVQVTKLTVRPARAPSPALRYRLLPELRDRTAGNAVVHYYRAFAPESQTVLRDKQTQEALNRWLEDSTKAPPAELKFVLNYFPLKEIDIGARRTYADWDQLGAIRKDGFAMLLPDIQGFRQYASLLAARTRFQVQDKKFGDAVHTMQSSLQLSRDVAEGPTLIQSLVGIAMATITLQEVEMLIREDGAPNLYWALSDLPSPLVNLRTAMQGERIFFDNLFPGFREMAAELGAKPLTPEEISRTLDKLTDTQKLLGLAQGERGWETRLGLAAVAALAYPEAKQFLLEQGRSPEQVKAMPVTQAYLIYEVHNYDRFFDDFAKWFNLPYAQAQRGVNEAEQYLKERKARTGGVGMILASLLVPAVSKVNEAGWRLERKVAALRCVEALRMYAAEHQGRWPERLEDVTAVPVPPDPMTGRPFVYEVAGDRATLTAAAPVGQREADARARRLVWKYELTLHR